MKEIKFRAYNKEYNHMVHFGLKDVGAYQYYDDYIGCFNTEEGDDEVKFTPDTDWIIMQFVGLHDKNGKEIYESDIIKYFDDKSKNFLNLHVVFENGCWIGGFKSSEDYICGKCESTGRFWFLHQIAKKSEVIGNVYENKELLK